MNVLNVASYICKIYRQKNSCFKKFLILFYKSTLSFSFSFFLFTLDMPNSHPIAPVLWSFGVSLFQIEFSTRVKSRDSACAELLEFFN